MDVILIAVTAIFINVSVAFFALLFYSLSMRKFIREQNEAWEEFKEKASVIIAEELQKSTGR